MQDGRAQEPGAGPELDAGALLARVAAECGEMALAIDALQDEIARIAGRPDAPFAAETIVRLQDADRVSQTLRALARLNAELGRRLGARSADRAALASAIGLDSVVRRLLD